MNNHLSDIGKKIKSAFTKNKHEQQNVSSDEITTAPSELDVLKKSVEERKEKLKKLMGINNE